MSEFDRAIRVMAIGNAGLFALVAIGSFLQPSGGWFWAGSCVLANLVYFCMTLVPAKGAKR